MSTIEDTQERLATLMQAKPHLQRLQGLVHGTAAECCKAIAELDEAQNVQGGLTARQRELLTALSKAAECIREARAVAEVELRESAEDMAGLLDALKMPHGIRVAGTPNSSTSADVDE